MTWKDELNAALYRFATKSSNSSPVPKSLKIEHSYTAGYSYSSITFEDPYALTQITWTDESGRAQGVNLWDADIIRFLSQL